MKQELRFGFSSALELVVLFSASILLLSACGGGGGTGGGNNGNNFGNNNLPVIPSQTGSVSAVFVANGIGQGFFIEYGGGNMAGNATSFVQATGALSRLSVYAHSGSPAVTQDIAGDADFVLGRWVWGTVTNTTTSAVLETMNGSMANNAWHYVLVNKLSVLPTSGTMVCDSGTFTHPSYIVYGSSSENVAVTTGRNASLSFSASGASYAFTLDTTMGATTHTINFSKANTGLGVASIGNGFGNGVAGGYGFLSDGGGGAIRISGIYENNQIAGIRYLGTYSFRCQ